MRLHKKAADANDTKSSDGKNTWKGLKTDPKTGKYIVYVTESTERLFDDIDSAVSYMVEAGLKNNISVTAGSPEYTGVERGQNNLNGVKQVQITRKLVQDKQTGQWKIKEKRRYDLLEEDSTDAKHTLENIDIEKTKAEEIQDIDDLKQEETTIDVNSSVEESEYTSIGKCSSCGCLIFPVSMDEPTFDRQQLADDLCPSCGIGLDDALCLQDNTQSLDNLIKGY